MYLLLKASEILSFSFGFKGNENALIWFKFQKKYIRYLADSISIIILGAAWRGHLGLKLKT